MSVTLHNVLVALSIVTFILAALSVAVGSLALIPLGLALLAGSHLT